MGGMQRHDVSGVGHAKLFTHFLCQTERVIICLKEKSIQWQGRHSGNANASNHDDEKISCVHFSFFKQLVCLKPGSESVFKQGVG